MGTGKSSAAITYMNEHPNDKFIYITPYLEEVERIKSNCCGMNFVEPSDKIRQYNFKKSEHTAALIKQGRNIATTHQAFKRYTEDMLDDIRSKEYRLIIDENVEVLEQYDCHHDDIQIAIDSGHIRMEGDTYYLVRDDYNGKALRELFQFLRSRKLIEIKDSSSSRLFYWVLPPELITAFKDVIILTYLFEGQSLHHFLEMHNLPYEFIGIEKSDDGRFRFGQVPGYTPEYIFKINDMIHIIDNKRMNSIGDDIHALSMSWFDRKENEVEQLKKNVANCFNNIWRDIPAKEKLWGTYKSYSSKIKGMGYSKSFLNFNAKATNTYRNRRYLIYITNIFMNVSEKTFYYNHGIEVDEDAYALSIMVQWIWRSAIRDGEEIYIYIPSKRMRTLLVNWMNDISKGGDSINE